MSELLQGGIDLVRPDERFGILVVDPDEIVDRRDEFWDAVKLPTNVSLTCTWDNLCIILHM
jgi:hypothetical protein